MDGGGEGGGGVTVPSHIPRLLIVNDVFSTVLGQCVCSAQQFTKPYLS